MSKTVCKYGSLCYRKNPSHFEEFDHPWKTDSQDTKHRQDTGRDELEVNVSVEKSDSESRKLTLSDSNSNSLIQEQGTSRAVKRQKTSNSEEESSSSTATNPLNLYLTKVKGLDPEYNNEYTIGIKEILSSKWGELIESVQFNYMFEVAWLVEQYPPVFKTKPLLIVAQDKPQTRSELQSEAANYKNVKLAFARLMDSFGTHHTKMMFLKYQESFRVVIHTANLIERDWGEKTQGVWMSPLFPLMPKGIHGTDSCTGFQADLIAYLKAYRSKALDEWINKILKYDMSSANVFLIGSVPGRHMGDSLHKFGHMKLRKVLSTKLTPTEEIDNYWPVLGQFSSIGTLGSKPEGWLLGEFLSSLRTLPKRLASMLPTPMKLIFPCVEDVRKSLEGYQAGGSLPYSLKTHQKQTYLAKLFHKWKSDEKGRTRASPHIKSYFRISPDWDGLAWGLITSANLSKAAWGSLEKCASQLCIRSYELGVLFLPEYFGDGRLFAISKGLYASGDGCTEPISFPTPFDVPLIPYSESDEPWVWDVPRSVPDSKGGLWLV